ncbi:glycosyltransferase family 39 protein [Rufibacter sp. XAAS-G3-1]|uniref:glycosyltransferase family 39 protein n=1 Tax=Rufibacter sp. XAAS-G3-1 TaxID=2729134 RepID=UPI0015E7BAA4|nr:glycosyltransferase family 39 protein [Rufibacter sp. XAAS-G3-1]
MFLFYKVASPVIAKDHKPILFSRGIHSKKLVSFLTGFIITAGIAIRLFHYFDNRSLWLDELYLAVSLIKMGFWELATQPLAYEQKGPLGFLWAVKLSVTVFGKGEMALRLFSLLAGIASLFFFVPVARHFLKPWAGLLALAMMALATPVVYHSVEAKQYSAELFASILALFFYLRYHAHTNTASLLKWAAAGAILPWFSYSVIFVLAGIAFAVCLNELLRKEWGKLFKYAGAFGIWLCSFGIIYLVFMSKFNDSAWLIHFFENYYNAFLPFPPSSAADIKWFPEKAISVLKYPMGQNALHLHWPYTYLIEHLRVLPFLLMVAGAILLLKKSSLRFNVLGFPILLALVASGLKLYPFHERFILFLFPMFILLTCYGAQALSSFLSARVKVKPLLIGLLLVPAVWNATWEVVNPRYFLRSEANREALLFINDNYKEGDVVYVYWNMWQAYAYYKDAYNLKFTAVRGTDVKKISANHKEYLQNLAPDLQKLKGHARLFYLYNVNIRSDIGEFVGQPDWYFHHSTPGKILEPAFVRMGNKLSNGFDAVGAVVSIYDLAPQN